MKPIIVGMTGASGAVYGVRLVKFLLEMGYEVSLVISEAARLVIREELNMPLTSLVCKKSLARHFKVNEDAPLQLYSVKDMTAPLASGSYPVHSMVVIPCSMGTLGAIAGGYGQNLIHRAADCILKEGRKLVLVPRETPLHAIHLENMLKLARLGARIVPAMPGFYAGARRVDDIVDFMTGKVLDQLDLPHTLYPRWTGLLRSPQP